MIVTQWLQEKFDNDYGKKSSSQLKKHLDSLDLFPQYRKKVELVFLQEKKEDILHPKVIAAVVEWNRRINGTDRLHKIIREAANDNWVNDNIT
jgi:hypothetical protein